MVASGFLPDSTAVSPYRLVMHLALALVLYAAIVWTGLSLLQPRQRVSRRRRRARPGAGHAWLLVGADHRRRRLRRRAARRA